MSTAQDDYTSVQSATAQVATDQATVAADQAKLATDQQSLATDQAALDAADEQLAADLAAAPGFVPNADGTITLLEASASDPKGYTVATVQPLSSISAVTPPAPAPAPPAGG